LPALPAHYLNPKLAGVYDLCNPHAADTDFYLERCGTIARRGSKGQRILDIGCGTGLLSVALAERGHEVVGVDPAPAMLEVARARPGGNKVRWHQGFAEPNIAQEPFDVVVMTGHVVQHLHSDSALKQLLQTVHALLRPGGQCLFESRNPAFDWRSLWRNQRASSYMTPWGRMRHELSIDEAVPGRTDDTIVVEERYEFEADVISSTSSLRFASEQSLGRALQHAQIELVALYGDWDSTPFAPQYSREMIFVGQTDVGDSRI